LQGSRIVNTIITNKGARKMTKKLKEYTVCIQYDVQKIYTVSAKNEEQAQDLVLNGKGYSEVGDESWENHEVIEVKEVE
jgi:hypothetical protein